MPVFGGLLFLIVIGLLITLLFTIWGLPFVVLFAVGAVAYLMVARKADPSVGTFEHSKPKEPTGVPRKASGGTETSNERVGQD